MSFSDHWLSSWDNLTNISFKESQLCLSAITVWDLEIISPTSLLKTSLIMLHDHNYYILTDFFSFFGQDHSLSINVTFQISLVALDVKICQKSPQKTLILPSFLALSPMKLVLSRKMLWSISNPSKRASSGSRGRRDERETDSWSAHRDERTDMCTISERPLGAEP